MTLIKVTGVGRTTDEGIILKDITFSQNKLQKIAIAGETGSGKTTLLKIIAGLVQPDQGEVLFQNRKVTGPDENLVPGHPRIAYLSQNFELPKFLRVEQVLTYANTVSKKQMNTLFEVCQIDHLQKRKTDQLSGGEKQRIALSRLLISSPRLLLLDEPFSHLDMPHKNTLKGVINSITGKLKITCILVSHDPADILSWADTILVMKDGTIVQQGTPQEIYNHPANSYVAGLFGKYFTLDKNLLRAFAMSGSAKRTDAMLRPEQLRVSTKNTRGVKGKVVSVSFFGSHYEVDVMVGKTMVTARSEDAGIVVGRQVFLSHA